MYADSPAAWRRFVAEITADCRARGWPGAFVFYGLIMFLPGAGLGLPRTPVNDNRRRLR